MISQAEDRHHGERPGKKNKRSGAGPCQLCRATCVCVCVCKSVCVCKTKKCALIQNIFDMDLLEICTSV